MTLMPIEHIPDWEQRIARLDACWNREIIDRPVVCINLPKANSQHPYPAKKEWPTWRDRWLDIDYIVEYTLARVANTAYLGDALPQAWPNLGPDIFATLYGCDLEFSERTSWSTPILDDLAAAERLPYSTDGFFWQKIQEMTDALLAAGKGRFYVGLTDLHVGGDCLAALRGPENLAIDLIERPEDVKRALDRITADYLELFARYHAKLARAGQACTTWLGWPSTRRWYVPSNDFSCMVSPAMFNEFFLPGITTECERMEASIYHLDGPNALQHLDALLQIPTLNAIQWVWGAGHGRAGDWIPIFQRCQAAGKGIWLPIHVDELELCLENLRPAGVNLHINGIKEIEHAEAVIKRVAAWR
ncbi:MAG: hypothetical protein ACOX44_12230 [Limnochordia bacterium]|jgi:hypothetical protein